MLSAFRLANFKAFAETQRIPLKPLTLIFGPNSGGKSSLIHGFLLACHAIEKGELDVHRTDIGGESVDLGGFRQYVHRREVGRRVEWGADIEVSRLKGRVADLLTPVKQASVSLTIGIELDDKGRPVSGASPIVMSYDLDADGARILRLSRRPAGTLQLEWLDQSHPVIRFLIRTVIESFTTSLSVSSEDFTAIDGAIDELVPEVSFKPGNLLPGKFIRTESFSRSTQDSLVPISKGRRHEDLANAVRLYLPRNLDEIVQGINAVIEGEIRRLRYLGPLRSYPPRHLAFSQHHDPNWFAGGGYAWDVVRQNSVIRQAVNDWLGSSERLMTPYEAVVRELVSIDQLDVPLLEGIEAISDEGLDIEPDYDDSPTPSGAYPVIKDPDAEAARLQGMIREADIDKLQELVLMDQRTNTIVSHRDVGIGISQVLPVLVSAYASRDQILAIEQPEIHLHPKLQAELGDVFIESALGKQNNTFIIETHSEHLILRILKRIRQSSQKKNKNTLPIQPDHVTLLFVGGTKAGSTVQELRIDKRGRIVDRCPGGFFEEDFEELF